MRHVSSGQLRSVGLVLAAAGVCATAALASPGAVPSRIVFAANRVPLFFGEVYRVNPDGSRVDLSRSPALDLAPAVSPDGKSVAFISLRGGHVALYLVGVDGQGLRRVSPLLALKASGLGPEAQISWSSNSRRLAVVLGGNGSYNNVLYTADLRGGWHEVALNATGLTLPSWSPDGRLLAYATKLGAIQVVNATGYHLWSASGDGPAAWSRDDRLAFSANSLTVAVVDAHGHPLGRFPGQSVAWAPNSNLLAVMNGKRLQLRPGGTSTPTFDVRIPEATPASGTTGIVWVGSGRVRIYGGNGWVGYDIAHKRPWVLPTSATEFSSVVAPDGTVAFQQSQGTTGAALMLLSPGAQSGQVLRTATRCGDDLPFDALQFIPHSRAIVYQTYCPVPSADLYAVNPDGSDLVQLTNTPTDETQPSLSPDRNSIVYVQQQFAEKCDGCPTTLWRVPASGGTPQQLTQHVYTETAPFDDSPTWSPDGSTIAFRNSGTDTPPALSEIAAAGGPVRSLRVKGIGSPVWGPKLIAFSDFSVPRPVIKTYDPLSGAIRTVLNDTGPGAGKKDLGSLAWSADGRLAYVEYNAGGHASIFILGSKQPPISLATLPPRSSQISGLAWSPDGTRFAFVVADPGGIGIGEIYTIGIDGKTLTQVTHNIGAVGSLSWR